MAFDTSGFGLAAPQEQVLVPSLANLAPYAPDFRGAAFKPANIQTPDVSVAKGIGSALASIGKGIEVAYKSAQDDKKELRKYALEQAKMAASEESAARKEASAELRHQQSLAMQAAQIGVSQGHLDLARQKQQAGGGADYSEWMPPETSDRVKAVTDGIEGQERPVFFEPQQLDIMTPPPESGSVSFDGAPLGAVPPQGDQRFASLSDLSLLPDQYKTASIDGLPQTAPTPSLPYALQGGVPRALSEVEAPDTRELYPKTELKTASFPTYGTYREAKPAATPRASSPIAQIPVTDPSGNIIGYYDLDRVAKKLIPGSFRETKKGGAPLSEMEAPSGFRPKSMTVNPKGDKTYTYEPIASELTEGQARRLDSLRGDYNKDPFVKNAIEAIASKGVVQSSLDLKNGFADIAAINAIQKMIDPGVAVREGDVTLIQQAIPRIQRWGLKAKNLVSGDQLTPEVRAEMYELANELADQRSELANKKAIPKLRKSSEKLGLDFDLLVGGDFEMSSIKQLKKEIDSLAKEIDSAKNPQSPEIQAKIKRVEELYPMIHLQNKK
jgi:hypothetical protein